MATSVFVSKYLVYQCKYGYFQKRDSMRDSILVGNSILQTRFFRIYGQFSCRQSKITVCEYIEYLSRYYTLFFFVYSFLICVILHLNTLACVWPCHICTDGKDWLLKQNKKWHLPFLLREKNEKKKTKTIFSRTMTTAVQNFQKFI